MPPWRSAQENDGDNKLDGRSEEDEHERGDDIKEPFIDSPPAIETVVRLTSRGDAHEGVGFQARCGGFKQSGGVEKLM